MLRLYFPLSSHIFCLYSSRKELSQRPLSHTFIIRQSKRKRKTPFSRNKINNKGKCLRSKMRVNGFNKKRKSPRLIMSSQCIPLKTGFWYCLEAHSHKKRKIMGNFIFPGVKLLFMYCGNDSIRYNSLSAVLKAKEIKKGILVFVMNFEKNLSYSTLLRQISRLICHSTTSRALMRNWSL